MYKEDAEERENKTKQIKLQQANKIKHMKLISPFESCDKMECQVFLLCTSEQCLYSIIAFGKHLQLLLSLHCVSLLLLFQR